MLTDVIWEFSNIVLTRKETIMQSIKLGDVGVSAQRGFHLKIVTNQGRRRAPCTEAKAISDIDEQDFSLVKLFPSLKFQLE